LKLQLTGLPVVAGLFVVGRLADLGFSLAGIVGLAVGGLVGGAGVVIFLLNVGAGLRVTTTWVGWAALGLRVVVRARLGVGLFGPAAATFGKAVKGVTATGVGRAPGREVGRGPGREVGFPKLLLSKLPPAERLGKEFCPSPN